MKPIREQVPNAQVYCPICTHVVEANVEVTPKKARVIPGQKCRRCLSSLDAGYVWTVPTAA